MYDVSVSVFAAGEKQILALIPISSSDLTRESGSVASDTQIVAMAMCALRDNRRFSDAEIESFRYKVRRLRQNDAPAQSTDASEVPMIDHGPPPNPLGLGQTHPDELQDRRSDGLHHAGSDGGRSR